MSLASRLPYDHPYAGGYPGIGSQPLPTDADALDYLSRMATADGAGVETGVAVAVDAFFRGLKATPGLFDAIKASCILCGARTITGALVPLAGDAPTAQGGWSSGDYSRTAGLTGDGNALYLDSNRSNNADDQDDQHLAIYVSAVSSDLKQLAGCGVTAGVTSIFRSGANIRFRSRTSGSYPAGGISATGIYGVSRSSAEEFDRRFDGATFTSGSTSETPASGNVSIFLSTGYATSAATDATIAFYSIGTSLSLEALDTAVSNLINRLKFALLVGENPSGLDPDTIDYIVRGYEAGGSLE